MNLLGLEMFNWDPVLLLGLVSFFLLLISLPLSLWSAVSNSSSSFVRNLLVCTNLCLTAQLTFRWIQSGHFPISNLYESLCFLTWACTLSQLLLERSFPSPFVAAAATPMSLIAIAFLSFIVWGHHMFITGMDPFLGSVFTFTTLLIAIPSAVKVFN